MSSTSQSHENSDIESSEQGGASSAEERVAGQQAADPDQPAIKTFHVSTKFALSLLRRLNELKVVPPRKVCAFNLLDKECIEQRNSSL